MCAEWSSSGSLPIRSVRYLEGVHVLTRSRTYQVLSYGGVRVFQGEDFGLLATTFEEIDQSGLDDALADSVSNQAGGVVNIQFVHQVRTV